MINVHNIDARQNSYKILILKQNERLPEVLADTRRVTLILENLLQYAIKMANNESLIEIDCETRFSSRLEGQLSITVTFISDRIESIQIEQIFEE